MRREQSQSPCVIDAEPDRISSLPGHIIDQILSILPIKEAVKTSILSTKWRYKWATLPNLVFDSQCISDTSEDLLVIKSKLSRIIDHVLLLHSGPIKKFKLSHRELIGVTDIDRWTLHLTRKPVKEFVLEIWKGQRYKIPSCLFSCQGLHHLELFNCWLIPPSTFQGFRNLRSLDLQHVTLSQDAFENLISSCPLLERLTLMNFDGFNYLNIHAPNLQFFDIGGKFEDISFKNTSQLAVVSIGLYVNFESSQSRLHGRTSNLVEFLIHLPCIQRLEIQSYFLKYLAVGVIPVKLPTPCMDLSYLSIRINFYDSKEISSALCLFRSSPNLRELEILLGMGSALETLCGQAFGAGHLRMMGIYLQRSWIILLATALLLLPFYIWATPLLKLVGQTDEVAEAAGTFALWMIPQLFAYALNFPVQKFLQAQRKVMVMLLISVAVLVLHVPLSWFLILKLKWGLVGAAITLNTSWWLIVICQTLYVIITKSDGAWSGFSWLAFADLFSFVKLSLSSAVMLCLEFWYLMVLVVITGHLANPLVPLDAVSICMNINGWDMMIALGFNAAISVRVSNELGAGDFRAAKFSVIVVSLTSISIGVVVMIIVLTTRDYFPQLFTSSDDVAMATTKLAALLSVTVLLNSLQPVLSGVAIGAGWQTLVAYINLGCYYIVGLPAGILLGFTFGFGAEGIWSGMIGGIVMQTIILIIITSLTNWKKEADEADSRVRKWGGTISIEN